MAEFWPQRALAAAHPLPARFLPKGGGSGARFRGGEGEGAGRARGCRGYATGGAVGAHCLQWCVVLVIYYVWIWEIIVFAIYFFIFFLFAIVMLRGALLVHTANNGAFCYLGFISCISVIYSFILWILKYEFYFVWWIIMVCIVFLCIGAPLYAIQYCVLVHTATNGAFCWWIAEIITHYQD